LKLKHAIEQPEPGKRKLQRSTRDGDRKRSRRRRRPAAAQGRQRPRGNDATQCVAPLGQVRRQIFALVTILTAGRPIYGIEGEDLCGLTG
jgi:hypothetical protein